MSTFLQLLGELAEGRTAAEMDRALDDVRERVVETGKAGKVTITLTVKPTTKGNRSMHSFLAATTTTLPKGEPEESVMYATETGYSRRDPRQPELPTMRELPRQEAVNE